ncbi:MAG TPA: alcohol dehydrogenase catalytic domain-containing protein, partial [Bradyrhizobium sp.]|nr:alcohol dehydrogenase catalytic domain-containing protein [Bradyrhizobium sp.]
MKTQAALLVQTGQPLVLADIEIPALKPGQALVEIAYSGACGTQVMEWRGDKGEDKWVPHCLGHEGTGTVLEVGSAITKVKAGDKVVLSWIKGSGIEAGGAVYDWDGKKVNSGGVTTFQRHAVVSENRLTLLPPDLPMDVAVLLGCAA